MIIKNIIKFFTAILIYFFSYNYAFCDNCENAESLIKQAENTSVREESTAYLHYAIKLLEDDYIENPININVLLKLSKINQMLGNRKNAKIYVLKAYNLHPYNSNIQKEMGDFYYTFQEYSTAIEYYKLSLASGNLKDFQTNLKTAQCYEKLGDIKNAELYYSICNYLNPSSKFTSEKINEFENLKKVDNSPKIEEKIEEDDEEVKEILEYFKNNL